ncbi:hypothetical protein Tco_0377606 [Tanacetum coccineum]
MSIYRNENGNEIGDMEKKVRLRKRSRSSGVKIVDGYDQPLQQFDHGLGVEMGNKGGMSCNVNANVVEETVKSCLWPIGGLFEAIRVDARSKLIKLNLGA